MIKRKSINKIPNDWPAWRVILTVLNIIAIVLCVVLSWHFFKGDAMPGCGTGSSCEQVLSSRWSSLGGIIPVSGLALGTYLALLIASFNISSSIEVSLKRLSWSIMTILGGVILGSAIWFTILQKWIIGSFCAYCMATHITGLVISMIIFWRALKERDAIKKAQPLLKPIRIISLFLVGLVLSEIVATIQFKYIPSAITQNNTQTTISSEMNFQNAPVIGPKDAPHKVTLLFDYQCSHCQKIHFMLKSVVRQYNGKLAFVLSPTPLENSCNPHIPSNKTTFRNSCKLAKIGLAVWRAKPDVFTEFENWMFTFDSGNSWQPRKLDAVIAKAEDLVGQEKLNAALADPWVDQYIKRSVDTFGKTLQNGKGAIPKMIYNNTWVIPEPYSADDLVTILQKSLGVPKP